jgi:uncharacterized protein (DUF58 family)
MALRPKLDDLLELRHQAHTIGLAAHHLVNSRLVGLYASVFRGNGMDFEEVREYREGDDIRLMDWRVTARTGTPHLKVFREERERAVMLAIDIGATMQFGTRGTFKNIQAARVASLLSWSANLHQDRVGALIYGAHQTKHFRVSRQRQGVWRILRALAEQGEEPVAEHDALVDTFQRMRRVSPPGALVFFVGDFNREPGELEAGLASLRERHEVVIVPVDDPADWEIPDMGRVSFAGPEGRWIAVDTGSEDGRRRYREAWHRRRAGLGDLTRRLFIDVLPVRTDEDVHRAMARGLHLRAVRQMRRR